MCFFSFSFFQDHYITIDSKSGVENGRLGIDIPGTSTDAASFSVQQLTGSLYMLTNMKTKTLMAVNGEHVGCDGQSSDVGLVNKPSNSNATFRIGVPPPPPPSSATVVINPALRDHPIEPLYMGCHSDSGFTHEVHTGYGWCRPVANPFFLFLSFSLSHILPPPFSCLAAAGILLADDLWRKL